MFLMYSYQLNHVTVKKPPKNAATAFYDPLYGENLAKIREIPYFLLKSQYLKITKKPKAFYWKVLESWPVIFGPVIVLMGVYNSYWLLDNRVLRIPHFFGSLLLYSSLFDICTFSPRITCAKYRRCCAHTYISMLSVRHIRSRSSFVRMRFHAFLCLL